MEKYKLAIIIPCWNCSNEIGQMLNSLIGQSFQDWRAFCVDDLSTDKTFDILQAYEKKDARIIATQRPREPKGAQTCRNYGYELANNAEYIIWFDSDDLVAPWCLEQRVAYMDTHQELDFGVFKAKSFYGDIYQMDGCELFGYEYKKSDDLKRFLRRTLPFVVWNNVYRRSSLERSRLKWDERIKSLQDSDFNIQSILKGLKYEYAHDTLIDYFYRINVNSVSKKIFTSEHSKSHIQFLNNIYESITLQQQTAYQLELDNYVLFFVNQFYDDKQFLDELLHQTWIKNRKWFKQRIQWYTKWEAKGKNLLFPIIVNYKRWNLYNRRYFSHNQKNLIQETERIKKLKIRM